MRTSGLAGSEVAGIMIKAEHDAYVIRNQDA